MAEIVALVTGASHRAGVGKGAALDLAELGATVYITARTLKQEDNPNYPGSLRTTSEQVKELGGRAVPIRCDHTDDRQVKSVFRRILKEEGRLDVLANCVWGGYDRLRATGGKPMRSDRQDANYVKTYTWNDPFWKQPISMWDEMFITGVRSTYVSSVLAAAIMADQRSGLIVNPSLSSNINVPYGASHHTIDYLTESMAAQLKEYRVTVVSLYPGLVIEKEDNRPDSESPLFVGRAVAALASDRKALSKTGKVWRTRDLAREYGFKDVD